MADSKEVRFGVEDFDRIIGCNPFTMSVTIPVEGDTYSLPGGNAVTWQQIRSYLASRRDLHFKSSDVAADFLVFDGEGTIRLCWRQS